MHYRNSAMKYVVMGEMYGAKKEEAKEIVEVSVRREGNHMGNLL